MGGNHLLTLWLALESLYDNSLLSFVERSSYAHDSHHWVYTYLVSSIGHMEDLTPKI